MRAGNRSAIQARRNKACLLPRVLPKAQKAIQQRKKRKVLVVRPKFFKKTVSNSFFIFFKKPGSGSIKCLKDNNYFMPKRQPKRPQRPPKKPIRRNRRIPPKSANGKANHKKGPNHENPAQKKNPKPGPKLKKGQKKKHVKPASQKQLKLFPWSREMRTIERPSLSLTLYQDGSRLYRFKKGGFLILTPEGVTILKRDKSIIKRFLAGEKFLLTQGGNSNIFLIKTGDTPLVAKEHHSGMSAKGQLDHMHDIRRSMLRSKSIHEVPEYFAVASFPPGERMRDLSVMEFMKGKKVEKLKEELAAKKDAESRRHLKQLQSEYADFERRIKKRKITLTDLHEGNILTYYNPVRKRYVFVVIDQ